MTKTLTSPLRLLSLLALWLLMSLGLAQAATETITYFHNDVAGTPILATDASGSVVWKENYQPYGSRINNASGGGNSQWFTGKPYDANTGLSYFGARYYDPVIGRFTGMDPAAVDPGNIHGLNRYGYGNNNPFRFVDPDGWEPEEASTVYMRTMIIFSLLSSAMDGGFPAGAAVAPLIARNAGTAGERTLVNSVASEANLVVKAEAGSLANGSLKNASGSLHDAAQAARTQPYQREITKHANQRLQTRDSAVTQEALETAISKGNRSLDPTTGKTVHNLPASQSPTGRGVTAVTNPRGGVVTVIDKGTNF